MPTISNRAQMEQQTFIYILSLIGVAFILIFGYKAINDISKKDDQVVLIQFQNKLKNDVESLSSDYGSVKVREYNLPSGFDEICFVDLENVNPELIPNRPIMEDSIQSGVKKNIFSLRENDIETFYIEGFKLSDPYWSCIQPKSGNIELRIEGIGNAAFIKTPPYIKHCKNAEDEGVCNLLDGFFYTGFKEECCEEHKLCCQSG